jgi:hypothetical protein
MPESVKILFIPASGPKGSGEYFRSINIAHALDSALNTEIRFILNKNSPVTTECPFPHYLIDDTPTYCVQEVNDLISEFQPRLVIFDATGRSSQLKAAKDAGAKTVFVAQNKKILRRATGLNRLHITDEIWIVQPDYMLSPDLWSRIKLLFSNIKIRQVGPVYPQISTEEAARIRHTIPVPERPYVIFNPGGGGHSVKGISAGRLFEKSALRFSQQFDGKVILIYGPNYTGEGSEDQSVIKIEKLDPELFHAAIMGASGFVSGGGGALFQAADAGIPTVAVALSSDQNYRIMQMQKRGLIVQSDPDPEIMADTLMHAIQIPPPGLKSLKQSEHSSEQIIKIVAELVA